MTQERCMELLDAIVNHVSAANDTEDTLHELFLMGFEPDELANHFGFGEDEVKDAYTAYMDD